MSEVKSKWRSDAFVHLIQRLIIYLQHWKLLSVVKCVSMYEWVYVYVRGSTVYEWTSRYTSTRSRIAVCDIWKAEYHSGSSNPLLHHLLLQLLLRVMLMVTVCGMRSTTTMSHERRLKK